MRHISLYFVIMLCATSCGKSPEISHRDLKNILGTEVILPFSINNMADDTYKVISYIDSTECVQCVLNNLHLWRNVKEEYFSLRNIPIIFIASPKFFDNIDPIYINYMQKTFVLIKDVDNKFGQRYHFLHNGNYRTFLLDCNDRILFVGSPVQNKKFLEGYKFAISKTTIE